MDFSKFNYAYALSGGIGSGKSSVCEFLQNEGYAIIDADKIAHEVLQALSQKVAEVFGEEILDPHKRIDRALLGKIVFSNPLELKKLEEILNPSIREAIFLQCQALECEKKPFFVEIPLLFEQKEIYNFKHKILISASKENQIKRICLRNHLSQEEALQRINSQLPLSEKIPYATQIIENNQSKEELQKTLKNWLKTLKAHNI